MNYITRDLENLVADVSNDYACVLVIGPRQVGKTTMLQHIDSARSFVTLDDLDNRALAKRDPEFFLQSHPAPVLIDEIQYAPELFPYLKIAADAGAKPGSYWLTGSQSFRMMELAQESLAGRAAILHMQALTQHELYGLGPSDQPFNPELDAIMERAGQREKTDMAGLYQRIWSGSLPGHASGRFSNREIFYGSYLDTYIDRDIADEVPGIDKLRFRDFIRAAACRIGQLLNVHEMARDVDVADDTAKRWLALLVKSEIVFLLHPFSNNLLTRTVKAPKLYFFDTGLVSYLTRHSSPEILQNGALSGEILENYAVNQIRASYLNAGLECPLWYYRDMDAREIDMVLESGGMLHPLEVKRSASPARRSISAFKQLDKASIPRGGGGVICMKSEVTPIDRQITLIPCWAL